ncbi:hypothetical protein C8R42DRAFT_385170 [Lentinula raphanica]|nr:hypothetical protein C8R42DRAFT_385170 [Lentinula raphanica]
MSKRVLSCFPTNHALKHELCPLTFIIQLLLSSQPGPGLLKPLSKSQMSAMVDFPRALEAGADAILRWRDAEVAFATKEIEIAHAREHAARIELQTKLDLAQESLLMYHEHLESVRQSEAKVTCDLQHASADQNRLGHVETEMKMMTDALEKIGIRLRKDTEDQNVWLQLICDVDLDGRWSQVQQKVLAASEQYRLAHGIPARDLPPSQMDAIAAIDIVLGAYVKYTSEHATLSARCNNAENELARLKKELEGKETRIAELEQMVALQGRRDTPPYSAGAVPQMTCISPSQLMKNPAESPYLSETSSDATHDTDSFLSSARTLESQGSRVNPSSYTTKPATSALQLRQRTTSPEKTGSGSRFWYRQLSA